MIEPSDLLEPATTECRNSASVCDIAEDCSGSNPTCPADGFQLDGTECLDGDVCNGAENCQAGSCTAGPPLECDDGDECTAESCDAITGCEHIPIVPCGGVPTTSSWGQAFLISLLMAAGVLSVAQRRRALG